MGPGKQRRKTAKRKARQRAQRRAEATMPARRRRFAGGFNAHLTDVGLRVAAAAVFTLPPHAKKQWGGPSDPTPSTA